MTNSTFNPTCADDRFVNEYVYVCMYVCMYVCVKIAWANRKEGDRVGADPSTKTGCGG